MEDRDIVTLYWQRDEEAIRQTDRQYGRYLSAIAFHILADREDSRETVNDTYLRAWSSMPPHRPRVLSTYLGHITRQLSIDRWRARGRVKRSAYAVSLEELGDCVSGRDTPEEALDLRELGRAVGDYLRTLPLPARRAFLCRYYYADSLAETERQRSDFIANISHELKTPMTTIAGYTDGILDGTIPPEKEKKYLQIISDESRRLSRLVRRMLDISRIQSQQDMKKEDFDLCESMRLALLSMEQKITDRGLDVEADIPEDSVMVQGVNDLITQVIYNLLENATKFAAPGSTLYLGLTETGGDKAVVTVRNTGHTIPPDEIPLLFERFHKSDKSRSEDKDGYGLGLYVVKTILSQHKEKISVTSENGVTSFSFTVQLAHPMRNT